MDIKVFTITKVFPWPLSGKPEPSPNWPEGMTRFWIQAHDSLGNENWDAANVMARSALQFVARERGAEKPDRRSWRKGRSSSSDEGVGLTRCDCLPTNPLILTFPRPHPRRRMTQGTSLTISTFSCSISMTFRSKSASIANVRGTQPPRHSHKKRLLLISLQPGRRIARLS
jgi:hypothetical protein